MNEIKALEKQLADIKAKKQKDKEKELKRIKVEHNEQERKKVEQDKRERERQHRNRLINFIVEITVLYNNRDYRRFGRNNYLDEFGRHIHDFDSKSTKELEQMNIKAKQLQQEYDLVIPYSYYFTFNDIFTGIEEIHPFFKIIAMATIVILAFIYCYFSGVI